MSDSRQRSTRRLRGRLATLVLTAWLATAIGVAAVPGRASADVLPVFTGEEFVRLFDDLEPVDTVPVAVAPSITGHAGADARIRELAEARGYRPRPSSNGNLEWVDGHQLHPEAAAAWRSLRAHAASEGIELSLVSGHRSVDRQRTLFVQRLAAASAARIGRPFTGAEIAQGAADDAVESVLRFAAVPGYSKHHTGLAVDVAQGSGMSQFVNTAAFAWISADNYRNAKAHGFVPSYPPGVATQGPDPEPWEYVWVGRDAVACRGSSPSEASVGPPGHDVPAPGATPATSRLVMVDAIRLLDTRAVDSTDGYLCPGSSIDLRVAGAGPVPDAGVVAVVLNVTATRAGGPGFVTVWPAGTPRPEVSSLNATRTDQTVPNLVVVPVGADGSVSLYSDAGAHLVVDVVGYHESATSSRAGRVVTVPAQRVADTRSADDPGGFVAAGATRRIDVLAGVPAGPGGIDAVVVNITATATDGPGFVTASPGDRPPGATSNLNYDGVGEQVANLAVVPVDAAGTINVTTSGGGAHLVVDLFGYVTSESAGRTTSGLFVPLLPGRTLDTRASGAPIGPGESVEAAVADTLGVPADAAALMVNLTLVAATGPGHVTTWPSGSPQPDVSNLNATTAGETRANAAIVELDPTGDVAVYSSSGAHVLADVFGYLTP